MKGMDMTEELKMWTVGGDGDVAPVEQASRTETEDLLEETLVQNPNMLIQNLKLVGRQTQTAGGPLDLLGVDRDGRLVVFELKRGELTREAITQVIDYASSLEAMSDEELAKHITKWSGHSGIDKIGSFDDWYAQHIERLDEETRLTPVKMILVGLGADADATRMVNFLAARGVDISLLTFHGYEHEGKTFLARQVRVEPGATKTVRGSRGRRTSMSEVEEFANKQGVGDIFREAIERFQELDRRYTTRPRKNGCIIHAGRWLELLEHENKFNVPLWLEVTQHGKLRVVFHPVSIHLCKAKFQEAEHSIPFTRQASRHPTNDIPENWNCVLDRSGWEKHKETLFGLAAAVSTAWDEAERSAGPQAARSADTD